MLKILEFCSNIDGILYNLIHRPQIDFTWYTAVKNLLPVKVLTTKLHRLLDCWKITVTAVRSLVEWCALYFNCLLMSWIKFDLFNCLLYDKQVASGRICGSILLFSAVCSRSSGVHTLIFNRKCEFMKVYKVFVMAAQPCFWAVS